MADGNIRERAALAFVVDRGDGVLELIPCNDVGNNELEAFFQSDGTNTTLATTQNDAGRDGLVTDPGTGLVVTRPEQPYKTLLLTTSA